MRAPDLFLDLQRAGAEAVALVNSRTRRAVATAVEAALTRGARRRGLLGRDSLPVSGALVLAPCAAIHTAFMRFPIDVVFVDRFGRAVRIVNHMPVWRVAIEPRAYAVIELAAGSLQSSGVEIDDRLYLVPASSLGASEAPPAQVVH